MYDHATRFLSSRLGLALLTVSLATGLGPVALAQSAPQRTNHNQVMTHAARMKDRPFLEMLARANQTEIELAELAQQKAQSADVKNYASKILKDHQDAKAKLEEVAREADVTLPVRLNEEQQTLKRRLASLSGREFDQEYIDAMVADHTAAVAILQLESEQGNYEPASSFAKDALPTIQDHLARARKLYSQMERRQSRSH
jgi:putative membrane protein